MNRPFRTLVLARVAAGTLALAGCAVQPPSSTILSRLPEPGASGGQPPALSSAERKRYDAIDRQVLREQNDAMAAEAAARAVVLLAAARDGLRRLLRRRLGQPVGHRHRLWLRLPGLVVVTRHRVDQLDWRLTGNKKARHFPRFFNGSDSRAQ